MSARSDDGASEAAREAQQIEADFKAKKKAEIMDFVAAINAGGTADGDLHGAAQDFGSWKLEDFNAAGGAALAEMRRLFLRRGLFVANHFVSGGSLAKSLMDVIRSRELAPWPDSALRVFTKTSVLQSRDEDLQVRIPRSCIDPEYYSLDRDETPAATSAEIPTPATPVPASQLSLPVPQYQTPDPTPQVPLPARTPTFRQHQYLNQRTFDRTPFRTPARESTPYNQSSLPSPLTITADLEYISPVDTVDEKEQNRAVREVQKSYPAEMKYQGSFDEMSLLHRTSQFLRRCRDMGVHEAFLTKTIPFMMAYGEVYDHCDYLRTHTSDWRLLIEQMALRFESPSVTRARTNKWYYLSLNDVVQENPERPLSDAVRTLYERLTRGQRSLSKEDQNSAVLKARLLMAYEQHPSTSRHATIAAVQATGPDHIFRLIYDFVVADERAARSPIRPPTAYQAAPGAYYSDRTYQSGARAPRRPLPSPGAAPAQTAFKCYICGKEGCRWSRHTDAERAAHKRDWQGRTSGTKAQYFTTMVSVEGDWDSDQESAPETEASQTFFTSPTSEADNEPYTTFWATLVSSDNGALAALESQKDVYALTSLPGSQRDDTIEAPFVGLSRYNDNKFMGFIIDTGAAEYSTCGAPQAAALQKLRHNVSVDPSTAGSVSIKFGLGATASTGSLITETPLGAVTFHVMPVDTPFLLSLADMDRLVCYYDNTRDVVVSRGGETPVLRRFGHPFIGTPETAHFFGQSSFFTESELRRLHRRFGHPSVDRLHRLLSAAGHGSVDRKSLQKIRDFCHNCQLHQGPPKRFKFNLQEGQDLVFNGSVLVDVAYIDGKPYIHVVDEATGFMAARWLTNMTAQHTWDMFRDCWVDTYIGPPDVVVHDQGTNFTAKDFKDNAALLGSEVKAIPTEAHHSVGKVERYHGVIERAYRIITAEAPELPPASALQMAVKAVNDTAGPNGLVPTLLVFGAYPRLSASSSPSPTISKRANAIKLAMKELEKARASRQISEAMRLRNGPDPVKPALNDLVLVWRTNNRPGGPGWDGPFQVRAVDDEDVTVDNGNGVLSTFRSTSVRIYSADGSPPPPQAPDQDSITVATIPAPATPPLRRTRGRPRRAPPAAYAVLEGTVSAIWLTSPPPSPSYDFSRRSEILGLLEKGAFEPVSRSEIPRGARLFNGRFVDEIKHAGTAQAVEKSRFVVQAHSDAGKTSVLTQSPTIQRMSQRLLLSIAACRLSTPGIQLLLRDISQAYVQATTVLQRDFFVNPNAAVREILALPEGEVLRILRPLYGVPEAGNHWFATYTRHHTEALGMTQSTYDSCLMIRKDDAFGIVGLQTDDTLILANEPFAALEESALREAGFLAKPREALSASSPLKFNGGVLQLLENGDLSLSQESQVVNISLITKEPQVNKGTRGRVSEPLDQKRQYVAQRARGAYVASVCQPEAAHDLSSAAQHTDPGKEEVEALNTRLQWQIDNPARGLRFVALDEGSIQVVVFTDAAFANNKDLSSQIGYVVTIRDAAGRCNIIHWSSTKCRRVTKSVLAAELYAFVHGFDVASCIKATLDQTYDRQIPLVICTDSKSVFDAITRLGTTTEKRLMIDVAMLRQSYERREIAEVKWIAGETNPADAMTKSKANEALARLVDTNLIKLKEEAWVEREEKAGAT